MLTEGDCRQGRLSPSAATVGSCGTFVIDAASTWTRCRGPSADTSTLTALHQCLGQAGVCYTPADKVRKMTRQKA
jgi:hypothetical protein